MAQPYLAMIIPISSGAPDQGLPGQPPGIWPGPGVPTPPIYNPQPPGIWPGLPGQGLPGQPPGIWPQPPGGGGAPDQGLPGRPPSVWPNPPGGGHRPDQGLPGGGGQPSHPITLPPPGVNIPVFPGQLPSGGGGGAAGGSGFILAWHPDYGWILVKPDGGGKPDQGLPGGGGSGGEKPDQGLPQPPTAQPKPGQR